MIKAVRVAFSVPFLFVALMALGTADLIGGVPVHRLLGHLKTRGVYPLFVLLAIASSCTGQISRVRAESPSATSAGTATAVQVWQHRSSAGDSPGSVFVTAAHVVESGRVSVLHGGRWWPARVVKSWNMNQGDIALVYVPGLLCERVIPVSPSPVDVGLNGTVYAYRYGRPKLMRRRDAVSRLHGAMFSTNRACGGNESGGPLIADGSRAIVGIHSGCDRARSVAFFGDATKVSGYLKSFDPRCGCPVETSDTSGKTTAAECVCGCTDRCNALESKVIKLESQMAEANKRHTDLRNTYKMFRNQVTKADMPARVARLESDMENNRIAAPALPVPHGGGAGEAIDTEEIINQVLKRIPKARIPASFQIVPR